LHAEGATRGLLSSHVKWRGGYLRHGLADGKAALIQRVGGFGSETLLDSEGDAGHGRAEIPRGGDWLEFAEASGIASCAQKWR
jgi:hypothetical protein